LEFETEVLLSGCVEGGGELRGGGDGMCAGVLAGVKFIIRAC